MSECLGVKKWGVKMSGCRNVRCQNAGESVEGLPCPNSIEVFRKEQPNEDLRLCTAWQWATSLLWKVKLM